MRANKRRLLEHVCQSLTFAHGFRMESRCRGTLCILTLVLCAMGRVKGGGMFSDKSCAARLTERFLAMALAEVP